MNAGDTNMAGPMMGLVLAGGRATRFGSDKALADLGGKSLLDHAIERLSGWCDSIAIAGRDTGPALCLPDWPRPDMGPLGGVAAGLRHARATGCATMLCCGVDSLGLPDNLPQLLSPAPAYVASQPVIAHWPVSALEPLVQILEGQGRHSLLALAEKTGAHAVTLPRPPANVNTPEDLAALRNGRNDTAP
ncbi:MAG: molybdenum cofactor guanylyltransferase [Caenibius sp.]